MIKNPAFWISIACVLVALLIVAYEYGLRTDTHHGLKYLLWKKGEYHFDAGFYQALSADPERDAGIVGKSLDDVRKLFPDIRTKENCTTRQLDLMQRYNLGEGTRWLGETLWTVVVEKDTNMIVALKAIKG